MSGRILRLARSPHQDAFELLPWYAVGTLEEDERARVDGHLRDCAACRRELEWLQRVQSAYVAAPAPAAAGEGLARLRPLLGAQESAPRAPRAPRAPAWRSFSPWVGAALCAQLALLIVLGVILRADASRDAAFHTLSAPAAANAQGPGEFVVVFRSDATGRDIARILRAAGARVVDGPTVTDGFVLRAAQGDAEPVLRRLRADPAVVLAEPLQGPGAAR